MKNINSSRIISTILIIALTAASLAGCGLVREKKKVTKVASLEDTVYIETDSPLKDILKSATAVPVKILKKRLKTRSPMTWKRKDLIFPECPQ